MWSMRKLLILLICLLLPVQAFAQLAVADAPVLATVASSLTVLKGIYDETVRQMAALVNLQAVMQQMQNFAILIAEVDALITEIETLTDGWGALSDSGSVICDLKEAVAWKGQAMQWANKGQRMAFKAQRLMGRTGHVIRALQGVIAGISGTVSGAQGSMAFLSAIAVQLQELQALTASANTSVVGGDMIETIVGIQVLCIQHGHFAEWGSYSR